MRTTPAESIQRAARTGEIITLGTASVETKGGGALPQPDSNQPMRQVIGIQHD